LQQLLQPQTKGDRIMKKRRLKEQIDTYDIVWAGIAIRVSFERNWLGSPPSEFHPSHLQIKAVSPERAPLPITETGYLSHFVAAEDIDAAGGPVSYALAWLDEAAKSPEWRKAVAASKQLSLF